MKPSHKSIKSSKNKTYAHKLRSRALYLSGVALISLSLITYHGVSANDQPARYIVSVTKSVHRRLIPTPKVVKTTPNPNQQPNYIVAVITPTPAETPAPKVNTPAPVHVIVPSPNSNVSDLTPAPSDPTPGGSSGGTGVSGGSGTSDGANAAIKYTTTNWAGYLQDNGPYTGISGSWLAPSVTGNGVTTSADATWIGIGGVTTNDLIQVGTQDIVGANGQVSLYAFYEALPGFSQTISGLTINAGDKIDASLAETSPDIWDISITDVTDGQSFNDTVSYDSSGSSAEWIEEDPEFAGGRQIPFDNFGYADFTDALATANGATDNLTTGEAQAIAMVDRLGDVIAIPSVITTAGTDFSVTQEAP